jgi:O-antigen/teichoic acid export membrane protein
LNCVFIPKFGIVAAAVSSLIAYILTFALYYRLLQEYGHIPLKNIFIPNKDDVILIKAMIKNMNKKYE